MKSNLFDLTGKVAIVTGGTTGIGFAISSALGQAGANLSIGVFGDIDSVSKKRLTEITNTGCRAKLISHDVREAMSCRSLVSQTVELYGRVDILINNAGISIPKTPESTTVEDFKQVIDTNLTGNFLCAKEVYPYFKKNGGGKIVNIASLSAIMAGPLMAAYAPSKAGVVQLGKVLANAWGKDNIQVNSILPGYTETDMTKYLQKNKVFFDQTTSRMPLGRWGKPEDFAGAAVFLSSSASDYITGASLVIDGGFSFFT